MVASGGPTLASASTGSIRLVPVSVIFAHRLASDLAAGIENALDHCRIDFRHVALQKLGADHHWHAGKADIVLKRDAAAGELAARLALDRGLHVPGAMRIFLRRRSIELTAWIFHRRQVIRRRVECGIGIGQRRDDLLDGIEIGVARIHAELLCCPAQIGDSRFLEHERSLRPFPRSVSAPTRRCCGSKGGGSDAAASMRLLLLMIFSIVYSAMILFARITSPQRRTSFLMKAAVSAGVPPSGSTLSLRKRCCTSGILSTSMVALAI